VGHADFFANFGQFLYQDNNPSYITGGLVPSIAPASRLQDRTSTTFMLAWQLGVNYHFSTNISLKVAPVVYNYIGLVTNIATGGSSANGIGDPYIGEGSFGGTNSSPIPSLTTQGGVMYNQVGVNNLLILDVPVEFNFKIASLNVRLFGDYAYNFEGGDRADAAFNALSATVAGTSAQPPLLAAGPQRGGVRAYQVGFGVGSAGPVYGPSQGLVYENTSRKHAWEFRTYWQRVEQYSLDPNLLDSDFFEGRANMEGIYAAVAYGLSDNAIATVRYGYAKRVNDNLGTGGSNLDIPQLNPINHYSLLQLDLTFRF